MKKTFIRLALGLMGVCVCIGMATACTGGGADDNSDADTATYTADSDTISRLLGRANGMMLAQQLEYWVQNEDSTYNVDEFIDGFSTVIDHRHPAEFINGATVGLQMSSELVQVEGADKPSLNRAKVLQAFDKGFALDSVSPAVQDRAMTDFQQLATRYASDTGKNKALADSVATAYGTLVGYVIASDRYMFEKTEGRKFDNAQFTKGIKAVVAQPRSQAYLAGLNMGIQTEQFINRVENVGLNVRRETVLENVRKSIKDTNIDEAEAKNINERMMAIVDRYREAADKAEEERLASSPEARQNVITGRALVDKMKESTPQAKTTASGLTYVIWEEGKGDLIGPATKLTAKYTGSHLDGKVFDMQNSATLLVDKTMPGLAEGLQLLRPGSRATFWIPGDLAFGARGVPQLEIGPMETVVYDITILSAE